MPVSVLARFLIALQCGLLVGAGCVGLIVESVSKKPTVGAAGVWGDHGSLALIEGASEEEGSRESESTKGEREFPSKPIVIPTLPGDDLSAVAVPSVGRALLATQCRLQV